MFKTLRRTKCLKCLYGCGVAAILLLGGIAMSMAGEGRARVTITDFDNVSSDELISIFKQAYAAADFNFKHQKTRKEQTPGGRNITNLAFEFTVPKYPQKKKGVASFVITSSGPGNQKCAPCSVYREFAGLPYEDYEAEELTIAQPIMNAADAIASAQIRMKLGKGLPDLQ